MTGRLIDADALIEHLKNDPLFDLVEQYGLTSVIETEITIDAIPVEWIKQFIKKENIHISNKVGIVHMVEQWKLHPIDFEISSEKCEANMYKEERRMKTFEINIVGETPMNDEQIGKCLGFLNAFVEFGMKGECGIRYAPIDDDGESANESIPIEFIMKYIESHGIYTTAMEVISAWREGKKE